MFPQLNVFLDDSIEPTPLETMSIDFWTYEELVAKDPRAKTSEHGMRLTIALIHCEGRDPKNLEEVKAWARQRKVRVIVGKDVDPTQSDRGDD
jgi:hypothetical protein